MAIEREGENERGREGEKERGRREGESERGREEGERYERDRGMRERES